MASLNKIQIIGSLGKNPETSYTPNGVAVSRISVATTEKWTDKNTGEKKEETEWHRIVFFGKQAETIGRYLSKGKQIYVEGRLKTSSYEKDGITRYSTDIIASNFQFLGNKDQSQGVQQNNFAQKPVNNGFGQPGNLKAVSQAGFQQSNSFQGAPQQNGGFNTQEDDTDIPF